MQACIESRCEIINILSKRVPQRGSEAHWGQKGPPESQKAANTYLDKPILEISLEALCIFVVEFILGCFLGGVFLAPWVTFGCLRCPKGSQHGAKMEAQAWLEAPCGKC